MQRFYRHNYSCSSNVNTILCLQNISYMFRTHILLQYDENNINVIVGGPFLKWMKIPIMQIPGKTRLQNTVNEMKIHKILRRSEHICHILTLGARSSRICSWVTYLSKGKWGSWVPQSSWNFETLIFHIVCHLIIHRNYIFCGQWVVAWREQFLGFHSVLVFLPYWLLTEFLFHFEI